MANPFPNSYKQSKMKIINPVKKYNRSDAISTLWSKSLWNSQSSY